MGPNFSSWLDCCVMKMGPNSLLYFLGKCKSLMMVMMVMRPPPHLLSLKKLYWKTDTENSWDLHSVLSLSPTKNSNSVVSKKMAPPSKKAFVGESKNRVNCGREWRKISEDKKNFIRGEREARFGWSFWCVLDFCVYVCDEEEFLK
jgi:hypothetical protein